jgi:hypothetical protein
MILGSRNAGERSDSGLIEATDSLSRAIEVYQQSEENMMYDAELSTACNFCRILMIIILLVLNPYSILEAWETRTE